jgi:hypothetical protein
MSDDKAHGNVSNREGKDSLRSIPTSPAVGHKERPASSPYGPCRDLYMIYRSK